MTSLYTIYIKMTIYNAIFMCFIGPVLVVGRKAKLVRTLSIRYGDQQTANKMTTATSILTTFIICDYICFVKIINKNDSLAFSFDGILVDEYNKQSVYKELT